MTLKSVGELNIPEQLLQKIDELRGDVPRSRYIVRVLEKALKVPRYEYEVGGFGKHKP